MSPLPRVALLCVALISSSLAFPAVPVGALPEKSISSSRQFIVYGTEVPVRGAICDLAERTKRDLLGLLGERDGWTTPIVVNARYPQANLPELPGLVVTVSQTGFGLKLQLDLMVDAEISWPAVRREFVRALLLEMIYRGESSLPAGTACASLPEWLLDGIPATETDLPLDRVATLLALPLAAHKVLSLEQFLQQRPELLDAPGRLLHRAYSIALVDLLRHAPEGPFRLARFIGDLRSQSNASMDGLAKHFPELFGSGDRAAEVWTKQISRLGSDPPDRLLSSAETERMLEEALRFRVSNRGRIKTYELTEFSTFLKQPSARATLARLTRELGQLSSRANPPYRAVIGEYAGVIELLSRGKTRGLVRRLERLRTVREAIAAQMRGVDDYLNWFEATSLPGPSGAFADYMKAADSAARPAPRRRDAISIYLDALEIQFEN